MSRCARPDISYVIGVFNRFIRNQGGTHWNAVKWILTYFKGTSRSCLCIGNDDLVLQGYTYADYYGDADSKKLPCGYPMTYMS